MLRAITPLHHWHVTHGARIVERDGWQLPAAYADTESEAAAVRAGVGLADVSAFAKVSLRGREVPAIAQALLGDSPALKPRGVSVFTAEGQVLACRLTEDHLLLLASTTNATALTQRLAEVGQGRAVVQNDMTSALAGLCLIGPHVEEVLRQLTSLDVVTALPAGSCAETNFAGLQALLVRPPESSLPVVRVYVAWDLAEYAWQRSLEAGHQRKIMPVGLEVLATCDLAGS